MTTSPRTPATPPPHSPPSPAPEKDPSRGRLATPPTFLLRTNHKGHSIRGGGGVQGVRTPPPFGPQCRLFNIGPRVKAPPWTCPDTESLCKVCVTGTDHTPPPLGMWMTSHGQCPRGGGVLVNVQEWGCFSIFRRADDVTRTMSKGVCVLVNVFTPPPFRKSCIRAWDGPPPPPFKNPGSAPADEQVYDRARAARACMGGASVAYLGVFFWLPGHPPPPPAII